MADADVPHQGSAPEFAWNATMFGAIGSEEARILLSKQARLVDLQISDLECENKVRHQSLRIRHIGDLLRLGFEAAAALAVLAIVGVLAAALWNAWHDEGLVIEAFNVPADMRANGLTGQVVATHIQDHLAWMQSNSDSIRAASTYRNDWGDDIKVQIPNTGVSIGEFYRYLAAWLGHKTLITGEVFRTDKGLSLSVRTGSAAAAVFTAPSLDTLIAKGSEEVYRRTQPYRYAVFLVSENRHTEEVAELRELAMHGAKEDRPWAWSYWGVLLLRQGMFRDALEKQRQAVKFGPGLPHLWWNLADAESYFGHDEAALRAHRHSVELLDTLAAGQLAPDIIVSSRIGQRAVNAEAIGDYSLAIASELTLADGAREGDPPPSVPLMMSSDLAARHEVTASLRMDGEKNNEAAALQLASGVASIFDLPPLPSYRRAAQLADWKTARDDLATLLESPLGKSAAAQPIAMVYVTPLIADAEARLGNFARAHALIDGAPQDCYLCTRVRGNVAAQERNWSAADGWYAQAAALAPSLPFAWLEWGRMRMAKGDLDGAIGKFRQANRRSPHFADPLEMWGEALIFKNRSDLAVAKFKEGSSYAQNWGRLHLKWGEALVWSGHRNEAKIQFSIASRHDLSPAESLELRHAESAGGYL